MDQETIQLIANHVNDELEREGYDSHHRIVIWEGVVKLIAIMDLHQAPIHNSLFVSSIASLARALELINSLRTKPDGRAT